MALLTEEELKVILDPLRERSTARVLAHDAALRADNAALLKALYMARDNDSWRLANDALDKTKERPGVALLAEAERLREAMEWTRAYLTRTGDEAALATLGQKLAPPTKGGG